MRSAGFRCVELTVVSHIQRIGGQPVKLLYTVVNPACGLLNKGGGESVSSLPFL